MEGLFDKSMTKEDSLIKLDAFVNTWVKDQMMISEAKKVVSSSIDIENLVEQYRSSLLLYNYETKLVEEMLDTSVTENQAQEYYEANKDQYILPNSIVKAMVAKIPATAKGIDRFYTDWKDKDYESVTKFVTLKADYIDFDTTGYRPMSELMATLPDGKFGESKLSEKGDYQGKHDEHEFFIKILDYHKSGEAAPFDYIRSTIDKIILNNRKQSLLKRKRQELYSKIDSRSDVKYYYK